ncbi:GGDEF domain-containing protein [Mariprofundus sp. NF]|uniref:GGDEF domain-containing protein n=1 Tax=Mariprofundus sp. NF TaxID=2608716 RepID=UPI0015A4D107
MILNPGKNLQIPTLIQRSLRVRIALILLTAFSIGAAALILLIDGRDQTLTILFILLLMMLCVWLSLHRLVISPILRLQKLARKIGSDEDRSEVEFSPRRDEIGSIGTTLLATEKESERQRQELLALANRMDKERRHDPLTKLHNRRHLYLEGPKQFSMAHRLNYAISVMMIDLDHFKQVNDSYGHAAGDTVLIEVAATLLKHCRTYDILIRFGGEEFTLVLVNCDHAQSLQAAERIRQDIASLKISHEQHTSIPITSSIGVCSAKGMDMERMIIIADECVYKAKESGRNCVRHAEIATQPD